jgi:hypothetical protein
VFYEPNNELTIKVTSAMPLLDIEFHEFPPFMLQGQLQQVLVEFKNSGKSGMCVVLVVAKMWGGN